MSGKAMNPETKTRRLLVRCALVLVYAGLIGFVFVFGKGHTLILDNKDSEDGSVKAIESLTVAVDGQDPIDLQAGERDMAKVRGQGHWVEITAKDSQKVERRIKVPLGEEMLLLSLPKLLAGVQPAVIPFVAMDAVPPPGDTGGNSNAFTSPDAVDPSAAPVVPGAPAAPSAPAAPGAPAAPVAP
jgi:hypothetical protein